jgi:hypothetical protein
VNTQQGDKFWTVIQWLFGLLIVWTILVSVVQQLSDLASGRDWEDIMVSQWSTIAQVVVLLVLLLGAYRARNDSGAWTKRAFYLAASILFIAGVLSFAFGERFVEDPFTQEIVDTRTGEPKYMMYKDNTGNWQIGYLDRKRLSPRDCRPEGVPHRDDFGNVFSYATKGTCYSPTGGGARMVPVTAEHAPALPDLSPFASPAEKRVKENSSSGKKVRAVSTCRGVYQKYDDCRRVQLTNHTGFKTGYVPKGICPVVTDSSKTTWREIGGKGSRQWEVYSTVPKLRVHYFLLSRGESHGSYTCS